MPPGTCRPRWALAFPIAGLVVAAIGIVADLQFLGFDASVFTGHDKPLHFLLYGACGFFAVGWFHRTPAAHVIAIVSAIVLLEELSQGLFQHRSVDPMDALASLSGVVLLGALGAWLRLSREPGAGQSESASRP